MGCWIYCILTIVAVSRLHERPKPPNSARDSLTLRRISILKPLAGLDDGLEENLESYFQQKYQNFSLYFAVSKLSDPAAEIVEKLQRTYADVCSKLFITGEPPYPHDKVFKLQSMLEASDGDIIVMSDSDVRVGPEFCSALAAEYEDSTLDLVTCPYRAIGGPSLWSRLEALAMNTDFHAGLFTAVLMEGARFAVGPTIAIRRGALLRLGGMERFKDYLSEDFMLGRKAAEAGFGVRMSSYVVEHRIGSEDLAKNFKHRLRWVRGSRRSRPLGYIGQIFTYPAAAGFCLLCTLPLWKVLLPISLALRAGSAWAVSERTLKTPVRWFLLPLHDFLSFGFWIAGFFGNTVHWRGRRYVLKRDGTLQVAG
ncbi:MAG TPA: glycosyltransferase [Bryobacteraceae bacterium]|nr:glycosyltransferase [Bryobacteraceae bacterium]